MAAASIALSCAKGEAVTFPLTHVTSGTDSTPINITGWTIKAMGRDEAGNVIFDKTATVVSGAAGTYSLSFTHAETTVYQAKSIDVDIWRTDSGSERLMGLGKFTIGQDVRYQ